MEGPGRGGGDCAICCLCSLVTLRTLRTEGKVPEWEWKGRRGRKVGRTQVDEREWKGGGRGRLVDGKGRVRK